AELGDDVRREFMSDLTCSGLIQAAEVTLEEQGLGVGGTRVIEVAIEDQRSVLIGGVAVGEMRGVDWGTGPIRERESLAAGGLPILRTLRVLQRVETFGDHLEDPRGLEVSEQSAIEGAH